MKRLGTKGEYELELHLVQVEEKEPGRAPRIWPLRVLRIRSEAYNSGV